MPVTLARPGAWGQRADVDTELGQSSSIAELDPLSRSTWLIIRRRIERAVGSWRGAKVDLLGHVPSTMEFRMLNEYATPEPADRAIFGSLGRQLLAVLCPWRERSSDAAVRSDFLFTLKISER
jgi:hypothetical protein